ncbi:hypothetical protein [Spiroplasma endosymbiont of Polydrusus pterygomalis]|uniref:hypothetical protein n=1 Tax=Spiroplasma endosymbiont of Polydrusus pterygomalis TaxID=3139327 RepID=UPI003CCB5E7D
MANKSYYPNDNKQLKNCKLEKYKIDNNYQILYKVATTYNDGEIKILKTLPLEEVAKDATDFFFTLMNNYQCDNFVMYYENNYDIQKVINSISNQELIFSSEQLLFFKNFFIAIKNANITLFDRNIKPIINTVNSNIDSANSMSNRFQTKPRILN